MYGIPYSVALGDLNGDGAPDLAVANYSSSTVSVLFNTTAPGATTQSFEAKVDSPTGANPFSAALGDLNGDGKPDLAVANYSSNTVSVLLNETASGATTPSFAAKVDFPADRIPSPSLSATSTATASPISPSPTTARTLFRWCSTPPRSGVR